MKVQEQLQRSKYQVNSSNSWYLDLRDDLVCWVIEICNHFDFRIVTKHLAVTYLDRILTSRPIPADSTKLVALISALIAAKYEEEEEVVPKISELCCYTNQKYSEDFIRVMESEILGELSWDLCATTSAHFWEICLESTHCVAFFGEQYNEKLYGQMKIVGNHLHCLCLKDLGLVADYLPSMLASAVLMACRVRLEAENLWTDDLHDLTGYSESDLSPCAGQILRLLIENSPSFPLESSNWKAGSQIREESTPMVDSKPANLYNSPKGPLEFSYLDFSPHVGLKCYPFSYHLHG
eukprot:CAMPEP_0196571074 /NCGR_PEP_ID=MMETSP1081-20130531/1239_1 /TAXON_ID=36882 /ORGANISM="Pyramimonas amylifera, Strain CCMP720" /LENGTH=293 /DNA_ID=CAMNT_0041887837 /DNA_START=387 /DNA_END=1268 /DNA_ORIENTATION=+